MIKGILLVAFGTILSLTAFAQQESLSDYHRYISYPYIEKAYRLQQQTHYSAALDEIEYALQLVPEYVPFHELRFELALQAGKEAYAFKLYRELSDAWLQGHRFDEILLNTDVKLADDIINRLVARMSEQTHLINLLLEKLIGQERYQQAMKLLESLENLDPNTLKQKIRLADQLSQTQKLIEAYTRLHPQQRDAETVKYYAYAQLNRNNFAAARDAIFSLNDSAVQTTLMSEYVQRALSQNENQKAYIGLQWLNHQTALSTAEKNQLLELALRLNRNQDLVELVTNGSWSCDTAINALLEAGQETLAKQRFKQCQDKLKDRAWLGYVDRLGTAKMLDQALGERPQIQSEIKEVLVSKLIAEQDYDGLTQVLSVNSKDESLLNTYAISLEKTGQNLAAAHAWESRFNLSGRLKDLDKATFGYIQSEAKDRAYSLLLAALDKFQQLPEALTGRFLTLVSESKADLDQQLIQKVMSLSGNVVQRAELLRIKGHCDQAIQLLVNGANTELAGLRTKALCLQDQHPEKAVSLWAMAFERSSLSEDAINAAQLYLNLKRPNDALNMLQSVLPAQRQEPWRILRARVAFMQTDADLAWQLWQNVNAPPQDWLLFGIDIALAREDWRRVEGLLRNLLSHNGELTAQQWSTLANVYEAQNEPQKSTRARQMATELEPENNEYKIAYAYSLIGIDPEMALTLFDSVSKAAGDNLPIDVWEQMAYIAESLGLFEKAKTYIAKVVHRSNLGSGQRYNNKSWRLKRLYRTLEENWKFSTTATHGNGAILGDVFFINRQEENTSSLPNNSIVARAEYFFDNVNEGASVYAQLASSGPDSNLTSQVSQEVGATYKIFHDYNTRISAGVLKFVNSDSNWQGFVKINGDALNKEDYRTDWREENRWIERQLYYDLTYYFESDQVIGQAIFDMGVTHSVSNSSYQTLKYYGLARYDYLKTAAPPEGQSQSSFYETAIGAGVVWRAYLSGKTVSDRIDRLSLGVEWRRNIGGELSQDNSGLYLQISYEY